jgi:hypothetical protein
MMRSEVVRIRFSVVEKQALINLTQLDQRKQSEVIRELVRKEAKARGCWPLPSGPAQEPPQAAEE